MLSEELFCVFFTYYGVFRPCVDFSMVAHCCNSSLNPFIGCTYSGSVKKCISYGQPSRPACAQGQLPNDFLCCLSVQNHKRGHYKDQVSLKSTE